MMAGLQEAGKPATDRGEPPPSVRPIPSDPADQFDGASLEDPRIYRAFVESLTDRIEGRLSTKLDENVQAEIADLLRLLAEMPPKAVAANRVYFEMAFDILAAEQPNLLLARSIRFELAAINDRSARGIIRWISYISGNTPLNAALSAVISTFILALLSLLLIVSGHQAIVRAMAGTSALLTSLDDGSVAVLLIAIHAAFIGGLVSILARIQDFLSLHAVSPALIYISIVRKPFLAATLVVLVFSVLRGGLISFQGIDLTGPTAPYLAWAVGFLCGFSERFASDFVVKAGSKLGEPGTPAVNPSQDRS
jgi:hypothetical protein